MRLRRNGCTAKKHEPEPSEFNECDGEPESDSVDVGMGKSTRLHGVRAFTYCPLLSVGCTKVRQWGPAGCRR